MCRGFRDKDPFLMFGSSRAEEAVPHGGEGGAAVSLYVGVFVAVAVFFAVLVVLVWTVRRIKARDPNIYRLPPAHHADVMVVQPDLTQGVVQVRKKGCGEEGGLGCIVPLLPPPPKYHHNNNRHDEIPPVEGSIDKIPRPDSPAASDGKSSVSSGRGSTYEQSCNNSAASVALPPNVDSEHVVWATVSKTGGKIILPDTGIYLTIPRGAIRKGNVSLYLAILRDDKDRPNVSDKETVLSPVVQFGGAESSFCKPLILSVPHCALLDPPGAWDVSVFHSDAPSLHDDQPPWKRLVRVGQETIATPVFCQVDGKSCHLMTEACEGRFAIVGQSSQVVAGGKALKAVRLAAFAPAFHSAADLSVRVYCVQDTKAALQGVLSAEDRVRGRLLAPPKAMLVQDGGSPLCLCLEDLAPGWRCKPNANYQEIPFGHVWCGRQGELHCSFKLERLERGVSALTAHVLVYQRGAQPRRQILRLDTDYREEKILSPAQSSITSSISSSIITESSTGPLLAVDPTENVFRLTPEVRKQLCICLDPPNSRGNDWRRLAKELGVNRYINYFATKSSPTDHILDLWEAREPEGSSLASLLNILRAMARADAVHLVEKEVGSWI